jgi:hypothetical protein
MADSLNYFKLLHSSVNEVTKGIIDWRNGGLLDSSPDDFKQFMRMKGEVINNDNCERVLDVNNRLYKDSKVAEDFKSFCEKYDYDFNHLISSVAKI